jgi:protocatechuate 3,4-dioxygenase beta subunit
MRLSVLILSLIAVSRLGETAADDSVNGESRQIIIRVLDDHGQPVAGADLFRNHVYTTDDSTKPQIENATYVTNEAGEAVVKYSGTSVDLRLWASKRGFVIYHAMWARQFQPDNHQIPEKFTFRLPKGTVIGGIVTNEKGDPIEGAKVEIVDQIVEGQRGYRDAAARRPIRAYTLTSGLVTDEHGKWEIQIAPDDRLLGELEGTHFRFLVSHPQYTPCVVQDENTSEAKLTTTLTLKNLRNRSSIIVLKEPKKD